MSKHGLEAVLSSHSYDDEQRTQSESPDSKSFEAPSQKSYLELHTPQILTSIEVIALDGSESDSEPMPDSMLQIFLQSFLPFFLGGVGSILAGLLLTFANRSFQLLREVPEFLILMPPLQGLKGNLDMTFSARMSTLAHLGAFEREGINLKIFRNIAVVEAQSVVICVVANLISFTITFIKPDDITDYVSRDTINSSFIADFLFLSSSSILAMTLCCAISTLALSSLVGVARKKNVNPDNIVTPLGASFGDLLTIALTLLMCYCIRPYSQFTNNIPIAIIILSITSIPIFIYLARNDDVAMKTAKQQCFTLFFAATVSCFAGYLQSVGSQYYPNYPAYQTLIAGLTGNRCAVQASRMASHLEVHKRSEIEWSIRLSPTEYYRNPSSECKTARLLLFTSIPFQLIFLAISTLIASSMSTPTEHSYQFIIGYSIAVFLQVCLMLYITQLLVSSLWHFGLDPDIHAIPLLTAAADLCGCGLLYLLFMLMDIAFDCVYKGE